MLATSESLCLPWLVTMNNVIYYFGIPLSYTMCYCSSKDGTIKIKKKKKIRYVIALMTSRISVYIGIEITKVSWYFFCCSVHYFPKNLYREIERAYRTFIIWHWTRRVNQFLSFWLLARYVNVCDVSFVPFQCFYVLFLLFLLTAKQTSYLHLTIY